VGRYQKIRGQKIDWLTWICTGAQRVIATCDQGEGGIDPEDGEDAGETVIEEDAGIAGIAEFTGSDGGDDDAADDEEEIDTESAVFEKEQVIGGAVLYLDAVKMREHDEKSREAATDLYADDSF